MCRCGNVFCEENAVEYGSRVIIKLHLIINDHKLGKRVVFVHVSIYMSSSCISDDSRLL